jgi:hypothetical protein
MRTFHFCQQIEGLLAKKRNLLEYGLIMELV